MQASTTAARKTRDGAPKAAPEPLSPISKIPRSPLKLVRPAGSGHPQFGPVRHSVAERCREASQCMLARQVAWIDFPLGLVMIAAARAAKKGRFPHVSGQRRRFAAAHDPGG